MLSYTLCCDLISEYSPFALLLLQVKSKGSKPKKKVPAQTCLSESDYIDDDDDALKQVRFNTSLINVLLLWQMLVEFLFQYRPSTNCCNDGPT
jgi:hypothetical protein